MLTHKWSSNPKFSEKIVVIFGFLHNITNSKTLPSLPLFFFSFIPLNSGNSKSELYHSVFYFVLKFFQYFENLFQLKYSLIPHIYTIYKFNLCILIF